MIALRSGSVWVRILFASFCYCTSADEVMDSSIAWRDTVAEARAGAAAIEGGLASARRALGLGVSDNADYELGLIRSSISAGMHELNSLQSNMWEDTYPALGTDCAWRCASVGGSCPAKCSDPLKGKRRHRAKFITWLRQGLCDVFDQYRRLVENTARFEWWGRQCTDPESPLRERVLVSEAQVWCLYLRHNVTLSNHIDAVTLPQLRFEQDGHSQQFHDVYRSTFGKVARGHNTGESVELSDIELFVRLSDLVQPRRVFVVGNAAGFSTLLLSFIFRNAPIDVIDAEIEGDSNSAGSSWTRSIAAEQGRDVNLFTGFSPNDTEKALRGLPGEYDVAFIDGYHSVQQVVADFDGIYPYLSKKAIVVFHDVRGNPEPDIQPGIHKILCRLTGSSVFYVTYFGMDFPVHFGTGLLFFDWPKDLITGDLRFGIQVHPICD